jgi:hypothetical protein
MKVMISISHAGALLSASFSIMMDGTFLSLPDSSIYVRQAMLGALPPSKASLPFIHMEGEPLIPRLTASS